MEEKFLTEVENLKPGLIIFRRGDVQHKNWYCRIKVPNENRYKILSLKTQDINAARTMAFDKDADIRFRVQHEVPIFQKTFAEVAAEYSNHLKGTAMSGQITVNRWKIVDSYIRLHLNPYMGSTQVTFIGEDKWKSYPLWRKENSQPNKRKGRKNGAILRQPPEAAKEEVAPTPARDGTIRQEMMTFRAIMNYAADKQYIRERQVPKGKLPHDKARREEFTPQEYKKLHTFARSWIKDGKTDHHIWYRNMAYNFMLIMTNTGMRTIEAANLRWRDVDLRTDKHGRQFVCINVRGKDKYRELVATPNVTEYLDRIKKISKAIKPDDRIFTTHEGKPCENLYNNVIQDLLEASELLISASGSRRSTYCFRHTYATFRLMEGVDIYFLAKQMGTSVKMIEDYYGHITPAKNAERILQGIPGWEPADIDGGTAGRVNADAAGKKPHKPRKKP